MGGVTDGTIFPVKYSPFSNFQLITSGDTNVPDISGFKLDSSYFTIANDNIVSFYFPANTLSGHGNFTLVTANEAGWATSMGATDTADLAKSCLGTRGGKCFSK